MRKWLSLVVLLPCLALGQGVARQFSQPEATLFSQWWNAALTTTTRAGYKLPADRGFTVSAVTYYVATAAGTATGTMLIRVTPDGSNFCTATIDCTSDDARATGAKRASTTGVCTFSPAATLSVNTTQCTTAQPTVHNVNVVGVWR